MLDRDDADVRTRLAERLEALLREQASGERQIAALDLRMGALRETLLRISGAIQVLEEILGAVPPRERLAPDGEARPRLDDARAAP